MKTEEKIKEKLKEPKQRVEFINMPKWFQEGYLMGVEHTLEWVLDKND